MERLQKYIADCGVTSRRKAEELILQGRISVNGTIIKTLGTKVEETDVVMLDGKPIKKRENKVYFLLNKPIGYICSVKDEKNRPVVTDLISCEERIYPVGRLDYDTTGALLLTNDGELTHFLAHPSFQVEKKYRVVIQGLLTGREIHVIKTGVVIEGKAVVPTFFKIKQRNSNKETTTLEYTIVEGRNHIVKKVFAELGHPVLKLKRESYANLTVDKLRIGQYRALTIKEVRFLKSLKRK